jgi:glycosyltransferase involved in cell wall biosynthesis
VIPNGISLTAFDQTTQVDRHADGAGTTQQPIVLTIARLHEQKGLNYLLEAAVSVPEAVFLLAGDGPDRVNLEAQAQALGLGQRVVFLGHRRDVPALLATCDVFVLPSLYEGMPLSILEAMAARKPVIATAIGGIDEVIAPDKTGLLVPPHDSGALAAAIRSLLFDRTRAQQLAANGRVRVEQDFAAEVMVRRVVQIYDELLGASGAAHA